MPALSSGKFTLLSLKPSRFVLQLRMSSIYSWANDRTPKRRELFRNSKLSIGRPDSFQSIPTLPSLLVLHGIEQQTWHKSTQALFSTQNCDVLFSVCSPYISKRRDLRSGVSAGHPHPHCPPPSFPSPLVQARLCTTRRRSSCWPTPRTRTR